MTSKDNLKFEVTLLLADGQSKIMDFDGSECDWLGHCVRGYLDFADAGESLVISVKAKSGK